MHLLFLVIFVHQLQTVVCYLTVCGSVVIPENPVLSQENPHNDELLEKFLL